MTSLSTVPAGSAVRVLRLQGDEGLCRRLREMGFAENAVLRCVQSGASCVCQVQQSRVGLSGRLAECILVEPLR